ncbi:MAG: rod shape-determining protein RodA [Prevotellaceae bacterium]|nr:rod shape-determining protein RodA [Prevotellaceae bacterium]
MQKDPNNKGIFLSLDWLTIGFYLIFVVWGWFSVCGASYDVAHPDVFGFGSNSGKQLMWIGTAVALGGALLFIEKRFYDTSAYFIYALLMLLLVVTIFIAPDTKGSRSWIPLGSIKLQPAEFSKFAVALALGKYMNRYGFSLDKPKDFARIVGMILLPMLLIVCQKETGSALVYLAFFLVLYREGMTGSLLFTAFACVVYFVVGIRYGDDTMEQMPVSVGEFAVLLIAQLFTTGMTWVYSQNRLALQIMFYGGVGTSLLAILFSAYVIPFNVCYVLLGICLLQFAYLVGLAIHHRLYRYALIAAFSLLSTSFFYIADTMLQHLDDHQRVRIEILLGKKEDIRGAGYNVNQAKIAIGSGGMHGKGFLNGTQTKLKYVPEQDTDFIFCTVGEEEGFVGSAAVLIFYLFFIWRLIALAERQPDTFGRVYGYCVCCIFLFHLFVNIGMVLGLTPVIGIPLPFFSYGGSSLWGFTILLFIFLRMDAERNLKRK